ncbi:MAG: nucleotidyl transferase AbiEii/AbiGii toxin family protein [Candidatus Cloacimonetes bacterium]|nr:nucleotidyl transferase AbiEii/AbiGii toxin family protein [Candidatus Cloacimonadota bacterium]
MEQEIPTPTQKILLGEISQYQPLTKRFYFTGGTALSAFYLRHRISEDLDFFSEQEFDTTYITLFFKNNKEKIGFQKIEPHRNENRFMYFLHFDKEQLKVDFSFYPYKNTKFCSKR